MEGSLGATPVPTKTPRVLIYSRITNNRPMDQIAAMRVFARVVEAGTFTRAADSLQMPKPTVTKMVQQLETHLRVKLLQRTTRRVTVAPEGAAYYERTARVLAELEDIESDLRERAGQSARAAARGRRLLAGQHDPDSAAAGLPCALSRDRTRDRRGRPAREHWWAMRWTA